MSQRRTIRPEGEAPRSQRHIDAIVERDHGYVPNRISRPPAATVAVTASNAATPNSTEPKTPSTSS